MYTTVGPGCTTTSQPIYCQGGRKSNCWAGLHDATTSQPIYISAKVQAESPVVYYCWAGLHDATTSTADLLILPRWQKVRQSRATQPRASHRIASHCSTLHGSVQHDTARNTERKGKHAGQTGLRPRQRQCTAGTRQKQLRRQINGRPSGHDHLVEGLGGMECTINQRPVSLGRGRH